MFEIRETLQPVLHCFLFRMYSFGHRPSHIENAFGHTSGLSIGCAARKIMFDYFGNLPDKETAKSFTLVSSAACIHFMCITLCSEFLPKSVEKRHFA